MKQTAMVVAAQAIMLGLFPVGALAAKFRLEEATVSEINKAFDSGALDISEIE